MLLLSVAVMSGSYASATEAASSDDQPQFFVESSGLRIGVFVHGATKGYTHRQLVQAVQRAFGVLHAQICDVAPERLTDRTQIVISIIDGGPRPVSVLYAQLVQDGHASRTVWEHIPSPDTNPPAVFMYKLVAFLKQITPAVAVPPRSTADGCPAQGIK
jgi:hypothetical protein